MFEVHEMIKYVTSEQRIVEIGRNAPQKQAVACWYCISNLLVLTELEREESTCALPMGQNISESCVHGSSLCGDTPEKAGLQL
eukprot:5064002-Amphidinium_carterae.2